MKGWIKDKLPQGKHDGSVWLKAYSDDVIGLDKEGCPHRVFYDYQYKNWNSSSTQVSIPETIICWIEMPEYLKTE